MGWFRAICALAGIFLVWATRRRRAHQIAQVLRTCFDERLAERARIARELHDTYLQTIQSSRLVGDEALREFSDAAKMRRALEQLSKWLERASREGREALHSLRTSTRVRNDLAKSLQRTAEDEAISSSMTVALSVVGDSREMHPIVHEEFYLIGCEAIRNAHAHSRGSRLELALRYDQHLVLQVCDNGVGIDPIVADQGKMGHFGLQGMRERTARIGGKLMIAALAEAGTEVTVLVSGAIAFLNTRTTPLSRIQAFLRRMVWFFRPC
jgi:signal transduction histidine kinase